MYRGGIPVGCLERRVSCIDWRMNSMEHFKDVLEQKMKTAQMVEKTVAEADELERVRQEIDLFHSMQSLGIVKEGNDVRVDNN